MARSSISIILFFFVCFIFCLEYVQSETVQHYDCWKPRGSKICTVHSLDIEPCPSSNARKGIPSSCEFTRTNMTALMKFSFTPEFNASLPLGQAHKADLLQDLPVVDMETNACKFTKCPLEQGVKNEYHYPFEIKSEYPEGSYTVKWKVWNKDEPIKQACCFKFNIILL